MSSDHIRLASLSQDFLNLILMPTEACNFRCTYCYETFEHKKMRPSVVRGIKTLLDRRGPDLEGLSIDWFGGEPLLAMDIINSVSQHAIGLARQHGFQFSAKMTTNGYFLSAERFSECLRNGIDHFQISFDGDKTLHDASRKLIQGAGTFDQLWSNVINLKAMQGEFSILLRLHFTRENYRAVADFGRKVRDALGEDSRFQYHFKGIGRWGGQNDDQISIIPRDQIGEILSYLWERSGLPRVEAESGYPVCYAGMANSLVIRSTGHIAKCTVALSDDFNSVGTIAENGELTVDQRKFRKWIAPLVEQRWEDAGCPLSVVARESMAETAKGVSPM